MPPVMYGLFSHSPIDHDDRDEVLEGYVFSLTMTWLIAKERVVFHICYMKASNNKNVLDKKSLSFSYFLFESRMLI